MPGAITYGQALTRRNSLARALDAFWLGLPGLSAGLRLWDYAGLHPGTLVNGPVWVPGPNGFGSLFFNGSDDQVSIGAPFVTATDNFTLSAAFRAGAVSTPHCVVANGVDGAGYALFCGGDVSGAATIAALYGGIRWIDSGLSFTNGRDYYACLSRSNGTTRLWVDGVRYVEDTGGGPGTPATSVTIGSQGGMRYHNSAVHAVLLRTRGFADADAVADYQQWRLGFPGLLSRRPAPTLFGGAAAPAVFCPDFSIQSIPHRTHPKMVAF